MCRYHKCLIHVIDELKIYSETVTISCILDQLCNIQIVEYIYKNTVVFKDDGKKHIR